MEPMRSHRIPRNGRMLITTDMETTPPEQRLMDAHHWPAIRPQTDTDAPMLMATGTQILIQGGLHPTGRIHVRPYQERQLKTEMDVPIPIQMAIQTLIRGGPSETVRMHSHPIPHNG
jgi:hypothetical protein